MEIIKQKTNSYQNQEKVSSVVKCDTEQGCLDDMCYERDDVDSHGFVEDLNQEPVRGNKFNIGSHQPALWLHRETLSLDENKQLVIQEFEDYQSFEKDSQVVIRNTEQGYSDNQCDEVYHDHSYGKPFVDNFTEDTFEGIFLKTGT